MTFRETSTIDRDQLDAFRRQARRCVERLGELIDLDSADVLILQEIRCLHAKCERFLREDRVGPEPDTNEGGEA